MSTNVRSGDNPDWRVFGLFMTVLVAVVAPLLLFPESGSAMVDVAFGFATGRFGWLCMLAGLAIVNWAWVEPIYYLTGPPFGAEPLSAAAAEWALTYGQFHWGITPWAIYCLPALPLIPVLLILSLSLLRWLREDFGGEAADTRPAREPGIGAADQATS